MQSTTRGARTTFWALSISLAATLEIEVFFLLLGVLRCFSSPVPSIRYGLAYGYLRSAQVGFPHSDISDQWIFALLPKLSQLITSFIGSQCQGIHPCALMLDLYSWSAAIAIALMTGFLCSLL